MPSDHMERILQIPFISPGFVDPSAVSSASCQHLQSEDAGNMGSEISESGWTMYLDQSLESWRNENATNPFDIVLQNKRNSQYTENHAERYPSYDYQATSIAGNEEDSSMASDASSGPQKLPLLLSGQDIEFEQDQQTAGSYSLVSRRKRGAHDIHENLECTASCSSVDVNLTRNKLRKVSINENGHHLGLLLQDTASSPIQRPQVQELNTRITVLQSLLPEGAKIRSKCSPDTLLLSADPESVF